MLRTISIFAIAALLAGCGTAAHRSGIQVASGVDANGNVVWQPLQTERVNLSTYQGPQSISSFNPLAGRFNR